MKITVSIGDHTFHLSLREPPEFRIEGDSDSRLLQPGDTGRIGDLAFTIHDDHAERGDSPAEARLLVEPPDGSGLQPLDIVLSHDLIRIGRDKASDLHLDHKSVSRIHAAITRDSDGAYYVRDLQSRHGVWVNHTKIRRALLHDGDELAVGEFILVFKAGTKPRGITGTPRSTAASPGKTDYLSRLLRP